MTESGSSIAQELKELEENSQEGDNRRIGLLISVVAIVLAICGALGKKAENHVIVSQVNASNAWSYFQAKKERGYLSETTSDLARLIVHSGSQEQGRQAVALIERYQEKKKKYDEEAKEISDQAEQHSRDAETWEKKSKQAQSRGDFPSNQRRALFHSDLSPSENLRFCRPRISGFGSGRDDSVLSLEAHSA